MRQLDEFSKTLPNEGSIERFNEKSPIERPGKGHYHLATVRKPTSAFGVTETNKVFINLSASVC